LEYDEDDVDIDAELVATEIMFTSAGFWKGDASRIIINEVL
jgi:hypothetical protein